jgi:hypothetical protein
MVTIGMLVARSSTPDEEIKLGIGASRGGWSEHAVDAGHQLAVGRACDTPLAISEAEQRRSQAEASQAEGRLHFLHSARYKHVPNRLTLLVSR